jgi:LysR family nitrogen assimilation transcriptional regulator
MELRQLRSFVAVAECGSFSRAAQLLGVTQPALSRQICLLEQALSQRLFHRNGRGAALNTAGRLFLGHAQAILARIEEAQREVSALREAPQGEVRIGLSPSISATLLRPLIASLASQYPRIKIHVEERFSDDLLPCLHTGKVDFAVLYEDQRSGTTLFEKLLIEELFLVHGPGLRLPAEIDAALLAALPLALPARPNSLRLFIERRLAEYGQALNVQQEMNSLLMLKEFAAEGVAATILPYGVVTRDVETGLVCAKPLKALNLSRVMGLAVANGRALDAAHQAVIRTIRAIVSNDWLDRRAARECSLVAAAQSWSGQSTESVA